MRRPIVLGVARGGRDSSRGGSRDVDSARDGCSRTASTFSRGDDGSSPSARRAIRTRGSRTYRVRTGTRALVEVVSLAMSRRFVSVARSDRSIARRRHRIRVERVVGHALAANRRPGVSASPRFGYTESAAFAVKISIAAGTRSVAPAILIGAAICAAPSRRLDDAASSPALPPAVPIARRRICRHSTSGNAPIGRNPAPYCNPYAPNARYAASGSIGTRARARKRSEDAPNSAPGSPNERASLAATARRGDDARSRTLEVRGVDRAVDVRRGNQSDAFVTESTDANDDPRSSGQEERRRDGTRSSTPSSRRRRSLVASPRASRRARREASRRRERWRARRRGGP